MARATNSENLIILFLLLLNIKANMKKSNATEIEVIKQLLQSINNQVNIHIQLRYK
uniref:hypothetical protein n=1 Tax=Wolbachia endosymbiont of Mansonella ozzardi TaxID=137464 RepID=UPI001CE0FFDB|nr:hypothetical protein [Wolbachia endosymbiont of Mansonella ozzardi]